MISIQMYQQKILIKEEQEEPTTQGGLFVPETITKNTGKGRIVAVGESKLRVGDLVLFDKRQASTMKFEGEEYVMVHDSMIIGVLLEKNKTTNL